MSNLNELIDLSRNIEQQLIESGGLITVEIENLISALDISLPAKIDAYAFTIDRMELSIGWLKEKADEYARIKKGAELALSNIRQRLKDLMVHHELTELIGERERFKLSPSNPKLVIRDENQVPANFLIEETRIYPDNEAIKKALKNGETVPGCELEKSYALTKRIKR
jgi:hypothetical protein